MKREFKANILRVSHALRKLVATDDERLDGYVNDIEAGKLGMGEAVCRLVDAVAQDEVEVVE